MSKPDYCPDGFDAKKYDVCKRFDREAWSRALMLRHFRVIPVEYEGEPTDTAIWRRQASDERLVSRPRVRSYERLCYVKSADFMDLMYAIGGYEEDSSEMMAVMSLASKFIHESNDIGCVVDMLYEQYSESELEKEIQHEHSGKLITVNLSMTDDVILASFKDWLSEQRRIRGDNPKVTSKLIDDGTLKRWADFRLLAYIDLLDWCEITETRLTQYQIGQLLYPEEYDVDISERVRKVLPKMREEAMDVAACNRLIDDSPQPER